MLIFASIYIQGQPDEVTQALERGSWTHQNKDLQLFGFDCELVICTLIIMYKFTFSVSGVKPQSADYTPFVSCLETGGKVGRWVLTNKVKFNFSNEIEQYNESVDRCRYWLSPMSIPPSWFCNLRQSSWRPYAF